MSKEHMAALQLAKQKKEAHSETERHHPRNLGSHETNFDGTKNGVGRIYQQALVETYPGVTLCKLYPVKTAITAADL